MRFHSTFDSPIHLIPPGIHVLTGVVDIRVESGQLRLKAGVFEDRPELSLSKAASRMTRLVILGHSGMITFQALRWLHDIGAGVIQIDYDASVIVSSNSLGVDHPGLRRSQALALGNPAGLQMVRELTARKIGGQSAVCRMLGNEGTADRISWIADTLQQAGSIVDLRALESRAANLYWQAWSKMPILFARKDENRIPNEWKLFGSRFSPLTSGPRKAGTPANAILNYLYALLEAETRIAVLTMGLDPGIGISHADQPARDSLVCDLMEPVRPEVDTWFHDLLVKRRFSRDDFFETPEGQVMITKSLAHELAGTLPLWAKAVSPVVEWVAHCLSPDSIPTKLTERRRSRKGRDFAHSRLRKAVSQVHRPHRSCRECGKPVQTTNRFCSPECLRRYNEDVVLPKLAKAGPATLQRLRSEKIDPAHGGHAGKKRGESNRRRADERKAWDRTHSPEETGKERERFKVEILPALADLPVCRIAKVTGLSLRYASLIRSGEYTPHPVHYPALERVVRKLPS